MIEIFLNGMLRMQSICNLLINQLIGELKKNIILYFFLFIPVLHVDPVHPGLHSKQKQLYLCHSLTLSIQPHNLLHTDQSRDYM